MRQQYWPKDLFGRITASISALIYGAIPLGGTLGEALGVRQTLWLMAATQLCSIAILLLSTIRRLCDLPTRGRTWP